jgi:hypothetical protein
MHLATLTPILLISSMGVARQCWFLSSEAAEATEPMPATEEKEPSPAWSGPAPRRPDAATYGRLEGTVVKPGWSWRASPMVAQWLLTLSVGLLVIAVLMIEPPAPGALK